MELTINNRFEEAALLFQSVIDEYPNHPLGYFYKGAAIQAKMLDAESYAAEPQFQDLMKKTIQLAEMLKKKEQADAMCLFYEGSAYLYRSFLKSKNGSWLGAYRDAKRGVNRLEQAIKQDSLLYDAYLGVGSFKYWKSAKADFLLWLPIISDEKEVGIRMVRKAIEKGEFVHWIARDQLCWILLNSGATGEALEIARQNAAAFPESRFFKWTLVEAADHAGEVELCRRLYRELLGAVRLMRENNHYNELECLVRLAELESLDGHRIRAKALAEEALQVELTPDIRRRARKKLKRARYVIKMVENSSSP